MNQECSFRQLLSVYYDREMDSPWKEKMEAHISNCADCAKHLEEYKNVSFLLDPATDDLTDQAQQRVLQKLESSGHYSSYGIRPAWSLPPVWKRRVSIPIPAAAAVVFMLFGLAFLWVRSPGPPPKKTESVNMAITAETEILPGVIPFSGMESVLQYLDGTDTGDILILKLPESRNFSSYGDPAIIKAADYSRTVPERRK